MKTSRIAILDFLRACAILIMIFANASPYCFFGVKILPAVRIVFSIAAPIFIFLVGYTFALNTELQSDHNRQKMRSLQILSMAVIIDLIVWRITPFSTFDVLYLIGISSFLLIYIRRIKSLYTLLFIVFIIFTVHIYLLDPVCYRFDNDDIMPSHVYSYQSFLINSLKRFIFDGWFPFFPWFAVALIGFLAYYIKPNIPNQNVLGILTIFNTVMFILLFDFKNISPSRNGYLELFYPVSIALIFFILAISSALTLLLSVNLNTSKYSINYMQTIGQYSLFVYLIHTILIAWILKPICIFLNPGLGESILLIVSMIWVIVFVVCKLKTNIEKIKNLKIYPILRFVLGI